VQEQCCRNGGREGEGEVGSHTVVNAHLVVKRQASIIYTRRSVTRHSKSALRFGAKISRKKRIFLSWTLSLSLSLSLLGVFIVKETDKS